jgi:hypothetical protein
MEVDFVSFAGLRSTARRHHHRPAPGAGRESGLFVPQAGPVEADGDQALAFVRSRHYVETIDGQQVEDPRADLGAHGAPARSSRGDRRSSATRATRSALAVPPAAWPRAAHRRQDVDVRRLPPGLGHEGQDARTSSWSQPTTNESGAVLILDEAAAAPVLDQVR